MTRLSASLSNGTGANNFCVQNSVRAAIRAFRGHPFMRATLKRSAAFPLPDLPPGAEMSVAKLHSQGRPKAETAGTLPKETLRPLFDLWTTTTEQAEGSRLVIRERRLRR